MEFKDLKLQYQQLKQQIDHAIDNVLRKASFISGDEVKNLERRLAEYVGVKHCITCANGTDALVLSLMACGISKGDAVFVPDFTFFATAEAPAFLGATPIFVDVGLSTYNLSPEALEEAVLRVRKQGRLVPRVVIAVDLFGQPANYPEIQKIADKYGLLLLEDGAQGFGGSILGRKSCSFGDIATTSFFPAKPLGCYGDGGAIFTDNEDWAALLRSFCVHGKGADKYDNVRVGMNSRLDTIQAAILNAKLDQFIHFELDRVNEIAQQYTERLECVKVPEVLDGFYSSWAQYTIICRDSIHRHNMQNELKKRDIPSMIYYAKGMHEMAAFRKEMESGMQEGYYKNTDYLKDRVLSLPIYPYIEEEQLWEICDVLLNCVEK